MKIKEESQELMAFTYDYPSFGKDSICVIFFYDDCSKPPENENKVNLN